MRRDEFVQVFGSIQAIRALRNFKVKQIEEFAGRDITIQELEFLKALEHELKNDELSLQLTPVRGNKYGKHD